MEGRRAHAVAHLAYARSQKSGTGILGSKRVLQGGEKSSPLVVLCDLWLVYRVYGLGGEKWKCGLGREIMVLGQTLVAGNVVRGEKLRVWVKPRPARVWSKERNYGLWSNADGGKYGPGREIMVLGQALVAGSVVQGEKLRVWVKPSPAVVWSREQNRGPGSSTGGGKCGPGRETAVQVNPIPARVWSEERNYGLGSSTGGGKCGPGSQTAAQVTPVPARVWSREQNRAPGSSPSECGPRREIMVLGQALVAGSMVQGAKPCPWVKPVPARVWSEERNYGLWSNAGGGKYGLGRETAVLGQALVAGSVV